MDEIFIQLKKYIKDFNSLEVQSLTEEALNLKIDPLLILDLFNNVLKEIGDDYQNGDLFLPELVGASSTIDGSMSIVIDEIVKSGKQVKSMGKVAIGTVFGDIHSIGKAMVATLLTASGFTIFDLGINVSAEKFVEVVEKNDVDILAMSALLTTTAPEQDKVIEILKQKNLRNKVKVIVGGGAITKEFAENIGADGYGASAPAAVSLAKKLLGRL
jgi:methanogenic corrinoid protein MtbC1